MCHSVLQSFTACCGVLQRRAACCSSLQRVAVYCSCFRRDINVMEDIIYVLQCVAVCYSVWQRVSVCRSGTLVSCVNMMAGTCVIACCSVLQRIAVCCSALQWDTCVVVSI